MPIAPTPRKRLTTVLIAFSILIATGVAGALIYLYVNYETIVKNKLDGALPETVSVDFKSLVMSPLNGNAQIENLTILVGPEGQAGRYHSLNISKLSAHGIGTMALLLRNKLILDSLVIKGGKLVIDHDLLKDTTDWNKATSTGGGNLREVEIVSLGIDKLGFVLKGDSVNECTFGTRIKVDHIAADLPHGKISFSDIAYQVRELAFDSVVYEPRAAMYRYAAERISYNKGKLVVDSLTVAAKFPKYEFAHHKGKQIDVFDLSIDSLLLTEFAVDGLRDSTFEAGAIEVHNASLHVFRDRRMPFIKDHQEPLPAKVLKELPYAVKVGALDIKSADIVYEEFPEEGDKSGSVAFRDVDAHFTRIDNSVDAFNSSINITVNARFMESGILNAKFTFPMNPKNVYYVEGTLDNFELTNLNPTLEHLAKVRIESGKMNSMSFNFDYNNDVSNGNVLLLYENLEMTALKEKESKTVANKLKSFFLNVLFAKRNKEDKVRIARRNGTIEFERDKKRSIFNYWWKSLATGIKTSHSVNGIFDGNGGRK